MMGTYQRELLLLAPTLVVLLCYFEFARNSMDPRPHRHPFTEFAGSALCLLYDPICCDDLF